MTYEVMRKLQFNRSSVRQLGGAITLLFVSLSNGLSAHAQTAEDEQAAADDVFDGQFTVDDADPEAHLPNLEARDKDPVSFASFLFQLGDKAEAAKKRGDTAAVVRFYRALAAAVPEVSASFRELCKAYEAAGEFDKAERSCEVALTKRGVLPVDYERYVKVAVATPGDLREAQIEKLNTVVGHLKTKKATEALAVQLDCEVAGRLGEIARLEACLATLSERAVPEAIRLPFVWRMAMLKHDFSEASRLVDTAATAGVPEPEVVRMQAETHRVMEPPPTRAEKPLFTLRPKQLAIIGAACLVTIGLTLLLLRRAARSTNKPAA